MSEQQCNNSQRIWQVVSQIPPGSVASYGQVAKLAGLPNAARLVGTVLKKLPSNTRLPWHRVINSYGKIAFAADSPRFREQKLRLENEGVQFDGEKLSMKKYGWKPL